MYIFYERMSPAKSFLPIWMFRELLEKITSFKEVGVIYKLFLEYIESHYVFKSVFESTIFILCATWLRAWMFARNEDWSLRA